MKEEEIIQHIIESSKSVFKKYGYKKVTMSDISKVAQKGRSTLYHYFKNKQEVFEQVAIQESLRVLEVSLEFIGANQSLSENLTSFHRSKIKEMILVSKEYIHLYEDIRNDQALMLKVDRHLLDLETKHTKKMLEWAIDKEEIAPIDANDMKLLSLTIVTGMSSISREMLFFGNISNLDKRLDWLINLMVKGLR